MKRKLSNKITQIIFIVVFIITLPMIFAGCQPNAPSVDQIKNDLSNNETIVDDYNWSITNIIENKAKLDNDSYTTEVSIELENSQYKSAERTATLHYTYYDKGGWILEHCTDVSSIMSAIPIAGVDTSVAIKDIDLIGTEDITLVNHNTDLPYSDYFEYETTYNGTAWNEKKTIELTYEPNPITGLWELSSKDTSDSQREFNDMDFWFYSIFNDNTERLITFYRIDEINETHAEITEVYVCMSLSLAYDGYKYSDISHQYNNGYLSPDNLELDSFVCNRRDCTVYYDYDNEEYDFSYKGLGGNEEPLLKRLTKDGLVYDRMLETTSTLSDVTGLEIPKEVTEWIDK